jgi:hypothetical protein
MITLCYRIQIMFCKKNIVTILFLVSFMCCHVKMLAQLCTGSLGDPVVNIDFGTGYDGNTSYYPSIAYTYTSSTCPNVNWDGTFKNEPLPTGAYVYQIEFLNG